jgi:2-polyprenyl-3-methyl-5-hydroxy-6-metoxy-1,4-benzoquinol methylase
MAEFYQIRNDITISDSCLCFVDRESEVLEIGSGSGNLTKYMKDELQCKVTCIERSPEMAEAGKAHAYQMIVADVETDQWENSIDKKFDCIMLADVLEHLRNPAALIKRLSAFLKQNGIMITSIPNIGHNAIILGLKDGKFEYRETGLLDNTHVHFMTRKSIRSLFEDNGFFLQNEESKQIRPCDTEFEYYYCQNPIMSLSLIHRPDAHIYRYIQQWGLQKNAYKEKALKLTLYRRIYELTYDLFCYIKRKSKLKTPRLFYRIFQSHDDLREKKRYDKYNS